MVAIRLNKNVDDSLFYPFDVIGNNDERNWLSPRKLLATILFSVCRRHRCVGIAAVQIKRSTAGEVANQAAARPDTIQAASSWTHSFVANDIQ